MDDKCTGCCRDRGSPPRLGLPRIRALYENLEDPITSRTPVQADFANKKKCRNLKLEFLLIDDSSCAENLLHARSNVWNGTSGPRQATARQGEFSTRVWQRKTRLCASGLECCASRQDWIYHCKLSKVQGRSMPSTTKINSLHEGGSSLRKMQMHYVSTSDGQLAKLECTRPLQISTKW